MIKRKNYQIPLGNNFKLETIHICLTNYRGCHVEDVIDWDKEHIFHYNYGCIIVNNITGEIESSVTMIGNDGFTVAYQIQIVPLIGSKAYRRLIHKTIPASQFPDRIRKKFQLD